MKLIILAILVVSAISNAAAQADINAMVETERSFARSAAETGTKQAFLANMADDALLFLPDRVNGKTYWNSRGELDGSLVWSPNFAAVSSNGLIGYTAGNWEYYPKGRNDVPGGFGQFVTIWQKQPDGKYKFTLDIGIEHQKPAKFSNELSTLDVAALELNDKSSSAADTATHFFELASNAGILKAYKEFAADDVRVYREGSLPVVGKKAMVDMIKKEKGRLTFAKRSSFFGSADLAYINNTYSVLRGDGKIEKGNFLQIWKLRNGRWQLLLDLFKPIPG